MNDDQYSGGLQLPGGPFIDLSSRGGSQYVTLIRSVGEGYDSSLYDLTPDELDGWIDRMPELRGALIAMREASRVATTWRAH
jgi:hypothetical protein